SGRALKDGQRLRWGALRWTGPEARGVAALAAGRKLSARTLSGADASADRVLADLPQVRYAHLATHGFFADKEFRSVLQVDPELFEVRGRERIGAGALSPMVMSGLVRAGADRADTPGRGPRAAGSVTDRDL